MTDRQFKAWREWLRDQQNRPDRHDHYLMQISLDIRRLFDSKAKLEQCRLEWKTVDPRNEWPRLTKAQAERIASRVAKARAFG